MKRDRLLAAAAADLKEAIRVLGVYRGNLISLSQSLDRERRNLELVLARIAVVDAEPTADNRENPTES